MAKPTNTVSIPNLSADFQSYMPLLDAGRSIEVVDRRTPVGVLSLNTNNVTSKDTYAEKDVANKLRSLFALVEQGTDIVITRVGKQSLLLSKPGNNGPK